METFKYNHEYQKIGDTLINLVPHAALFEKWGTQCNQLILYCELAQKSFYIDGPSWELRVYDVRAIQEKLEKYGWSANGFDKDILYDKCPKIKSSPLSVKTTNAIQTYYNLTIELANALGINPHETSSFESHSISNALITLRELQTLSSRVEPDPTLKGLTILKKLHLIFFSRINPRNIKFHYLFLNWNYIFI